ncbi:SRPBCC family protein [Zhouia amylolytica]|uniref:SRPBCC family protein n=1 Tax=Zhouia amylolytica TaxID=376730 RepID=UPI0005701B8F|nr:SRPBCC domain-containing protein [Zhouia amylolytica]
MGRKIFSVEQEYNASISQVWSAISDKSQMKLWYFDLEKFKLQKGFQFSFIGQGATGEKYIHLCEITEVVPEKKLQYSWKYKGYVGTSLVTFELFKEARKTRLKLTHEGLETFDQHNPDFASANFEAGWTELIGNLLRVHLEGK